MNKNFKKIISLVLTVLMLAGTVTMLVPVSASEVSKTLTINTELDIKGVKVRLDAHEDHASSSLTLSPDGSVHMKGQRGDLFWLSNVELTADSVFTTTVTFAAAKTPGSCCAGTVYDIDANGAWDEANDTAIVAALRTFSGGNSRRSIATTNYEKATVNADFVDVLTDVEYTATNTNFGNSWQVGKTVTTVISQASDGTVSAVFTDGKGDAITSASYNNITYPLEGFVGYMTHWTNAPKNSPAEYNEYTIKEFKITNAKVDGKLVDEVNFTKLVKEYYSENFGNSVDAKKIAGNTFVAVNDLILRMDYPTPAHSSSSLTLCPDGSVKMKGSRGDLFWLSNVELTADSVFTTTVTFDAAAAPNSCCAGTAYGIDANGAWNEGADTAIVAALRTYSNKYSRRSIATTNYTKATESADFVTVLTDVDYTATNTNFGTSWQPGKTVTTVISQASDGKVSAVFTDENGDAITSASYTNSSYPLGGNVGYMTHWTDGKDYNEYTISEFKVTNAIVNGVLVKELDLIAEVREYMNPTKGVTEEAINLSLDGTIGLNFAFNADAGVPAGATVVATKNGEVVDTKDVADGENVITAPVNAKEMNDTVNFAIMVGGEVYKSYTASVKEYAERLLDDAVWGDLMSAMLKYGAAAQKLLDYKADEADVSGVVDYDFSAYEAVEFDDGIKSVLKGLHMNLSLESDTVLNLYFMPTDGTTLDVTVNGNTAALVENGDGYYVLSIEGIAADKLDDNFAIVVNGTSLFNVNALNWAKIASEDANENVATLANALAVYASCANEIISKN